jgi:class 3 adenylate cyclase
MQRTTPEHPKAPGDGDAAADNFEKRLRLDLKFEPMIDSRTGEKGVIIVLDRSRYRIVDDADEPMVIDELGHVAIPLRLVQKMIDEACSRRPTGRGQCLGDASAYIQGRREQIKRRLADQTKQPHEFVDRSEEFLAQLPDGVHGFAVLSVDLVGSTKLSNAIDAVTNARVIGVILDEIAAVAPYFHAHILKFTGDGVLAYIPPPSFLTANDNAVDFALTVRGLIRDAVNPTFAELGYPGLDVRIGIESGGAVAMTVGHASSKRQRDLIGQTLNIACKIQASGNPGEIRIGQVAFQNMHTMWKQGCDRAPSPESWTYTLADGGEYPLYIFTATGAVLA